MMEEKELTKEMKIKMINEMESLKDIDTMMEVGTMKDMGTIESEIDMEKMKDIEIVKDMRMVKDNESMKRIGVLMEMEPTINIESMKELESMEDLELFKDEINYVKTVQGKEDPKNFTTTETINDQKTKLNKTMKNIENPSEKIMITDDENEIPSKFVLKTDEYSENNKIDEDLILVNEIFNITNHVREEESTPTISPLAKEMIEQVFDIEITTTKDNTEVSTEMPNKKINEGSEQTLLLEEIFSTYSTDSIDINGAENLNEDEIFYDTDFILTTVKNQPLEDAETDFNLVSATEKIPSSGNDIIKEAVQEFTLNPLIIVTERTLEETTFGIVELVTSKAIEKLHEETTQVILYFYFIIFLLKVS